MKVKIKKSVSIPDWFNLSKYESAKDMPLLDWALNLDVRRLLHSFCASDQFNNGAVEYQKDLMRMFVLIKEHGFLSRSHTRDRCEDLKEFFQVDKTKPGFGLVYPLRLDQAHSIYEIIHNDTELRNKISLVDYQDILSPLRTEEMSHGEIKLLKWHEAYFSMASLSEHCNVDFDSGSPVICVDRCAPDDTIVDAFKDWLKAVRIDSDNNWGTDAPERIPTKLTERWVSSAILPYLDLIIYQQVEGITLPTHIVGNAIFPVTMDIDTTEAVRKTTRPNAEKALSHSYAILRHALVAEERQKNGKEIG
jgi:hypothetical protein